MLKNSNEEDNLVLIDITPKYGFWKPTRIGDKIKGTLLSITPAPYKGLANSKYCLQSDHPESVDGKIMFYGTYCINRALNKPELIGKTIIITYKGENNNNKNPMKKTIEKIQNRTRIKQKRPFIHPIQNLYN